MGISKASGKLAMTHNGLEIEQSGISASGLCNRGASLFVSDAYSV
jgi:hypothetical protein